MAQAKTPVKYFAAVLTSDTTLLPQIVKLLIKRFGPTDFSGDWVNFTYTNFYEPEMGPNLKRCLVSFQRTMPSQLLPKAKKWTQKIEDKFRLEGKRQVNIDAGYLDFCKVVLVSGKFGGHKIALTDDCFADMILDYQKGAWRPFQWCFPDFASGVYNSDLNKIRGLFKKGSSPNRAGKFG